MRPSKLRRPTDTFKPPAPPARDSDASFASSRPSSVGVGRSFSAIDAYSDRSFQASALRSINSFLASHSLPPLPTKPSQVPSLKEITETLKSLLSFLQFPSGKLEDDLFLLLKSLNCPFKISKSSLRAPNTPHNWPTCLGLIHWLVQIVMYNEHLSRNSLVLDSFAASGSMNGYALESYMRYIRGEDDLVEVLDREFTEKLERERQNVAENLKALETSARELEAKAEGLKTGPTEREVLEQQRRVLEDDVNKFHAMIAELNARIGALQKLLEEKEKELQTKEEERNRICEENEELKKRVELQTINSRDVERMRRELQAMERDIGEAELARNSWEDKCWDVDAAIGNKFTELQALAIECNQAIRRLKLSNGFQYELNAQGRTPAEIMGVDYKSTLRPELQSYADKVRESSKQKFDELIILQQHSKDMAAKIEERKNHIVAVQSHISKVEAQISLMKKEMQDHTYKCEAEAKKMFEDVEIEAHNINTVEREAAEVLKASQLELDEAIKQSEEEIQFHARQLFALVDSISKYKECVESKISTMRSDLSETAGAVLDVYKGSTLVQFNDTEGTRQ